MLCCTVFCYSLVFRYIFMFIFIHISSSTIIFNINFLAHGKKDKSCLHETTVKSMFKPFIYIICYNTCAFMLKYIFIHSFKCPQFGGQNHQNLRFLEFVKKRKMANFKSKNLCDESLKIKNLR